MLGKDGALTLIVEDYGNFDSAGHEQVVRELIGMRPKEMVKCFNILINLSDEARQAGIK